MQAEVTLTLTREELLYLKTAVRRDVEDLKDLGESGPCQDIIDADLRHGQSVLERIERTEQTQVYVH